MAHIPHLPVSKITDISQHPQEYGLIQHWNQFRFSKLKWKKYSKNMQRSIIDFTRSGMMKSNARRF